MKPDRGCFVSIAIEARRRPNQFAGARERAGRGPSESPLWGDKFAPQMSQRTKRASSCRVLLRQSTPEKRTAMAASAAYLIALALTLLILVVLWENFS